MGRLPKIILMIAAMTAIFLWMSTAFNSCGDNADGLLDDTDDTFTEIIDDTDEFVDDVSEDLFEGGEEDDLFEDTDEGDDNLTFVGGDEIEETDFTSEGDDYSNTYVSTTSSTSSGNYMIIAGNYLVESNARSMTKKLSNLGYPDAEIGVFDRSQYHTVIATRQSDYATALEMANAIKRKGIDCYIKKRQY